MKVSVILVIMMLLVSSAGAQYFELGGGIMISADNDHFGTGGGAYGYASVYPLPSVSIRGTALAWGGSTEGEVLSIGDYLVGGLEGTLVAHLETAPWCKLRAGAGLGAYFLDTEEENYRRSARGGVRREYREGRESIDDELGLHVLAGADLVIYENMSFFVEVKHIFLESDVLVEDYNDEADDYDRYEEQLDLDTTTVNLGFRMLF